MKAGIPPRLVEQSEADALYDFELGAPAPVRTALGMASLRIGGGVVLAMRNDPTEFWSKVLGLGFEEPVTADLIGEVCDFYRAQGTPIAVLQIAPSVLPQDWAEICAAQKLSAAGTWAKLVCDVDTAITRIEEPGRPEAQVRTAPVEAGRAAEWASVLLRVFGMPEQGLSQMVAASVGRPDWHPYAAWDGDELVATGTMHVGQGTAQFFAGATVPHARRRGAQSALVAARARAAKAAGCRWLVAETGVEAPGTHNSSLHNLLRAGFEVHYERQNWIWRADGR